MRRCVILLWILAVLTVPVLALDVLEEERQILNVDTLTDGLPDDAQDALRTYSPAARTDPGEAILAIIKWASGLSVSTLREAVQTASLLLTGALVCHLLGGRGPGVFPPEGAAGLPACAPERPGRPAAYSGHDRSAGYHAAVRNQYEKYARSGSLCAG